MRTVGIALTLLSSLIGTTMLAQQPTQGMHWVGTWASAQMLVDGPDLSAEDFRDATLRQVVHVSSGGSRIRLRLSNAFGTAPLQIQMVHVAKPASVVNCRIDPSSDKPLRFSGNTAVTIPPGAEYLSDPIDFPVASLTDLTVTMYLETPSLHQTGHIAAHTTSCLGARNLVTAADIPDAKKFQHWFYLAGVEVESPPDAAAVVTLGDSITDGTGSTLNGNDRWPDVLAARLQAGAASRRWSVLNVGIGGNHMLTDGVGPNALARLDRDVLAQPGVRAVIVFEGVNDLGGWTRNGPISKEEHDVFVARLIASYEQVIERAHASGLTVIGATILGYQGAANYHPDAANLADWQRVNDWIRQPGHFDAVVDLDKATADPAHPGRMSPTTGSADNLHPGPAGYKMMGDAFPLSLFH
ncbi:MAG: SGNH/GDSL hydrolase family protein [Acidobacteriaceae bacterium]|jgi:lysophospholipase L1-like esterase